MNYYWISINDEKVSTVAYAPQGTPSSYELIPKMADNNTLPFPLRLYEVSVNDKLEKGAISDTYYDYQPNSLAWPLMSKRMASIIASHLTGLENIEWREVMVEGCTSSRKYYVPLFTTELDTLNVTESVFVPSSRIVLKPCFKMEKVEKYAMFHGYGKFWQITSQIYVNEEIKQVLDDMNLEELSFSKIHIK